MPLSPYDPAYGAIPVPDVGIFDEPEISVCINPKWAAYIDGAVSRLLRRSVWLGDEDAQTFATGEIRKFLAALQERIPCEPTMRALVPTEIDISPATVFPLLLKSVAAGETIDELLVTVDEVWDAGTLTIGDAGDPERLMTAAYNSLALAEQFQVSPQYKYVSPADVYIYLSGAPTTGSARITLYSYLEA